MGFKILAINPGSTSTKAALYEDERLLLEVTLRHTPEQLARFHSVMDQMEWRRDMILRGVEERGFPVSDLSAVIGRGGLTKPIESGIYEVDDAMVHDLHHPRMMHACNLGGLIAREIAQRAGVKAYIADPGVVEEMDELVHMTGLPQIRRISILHTLNQRAIARIYAREQGRKYEEMNLVIMHMGGGISVAAHERGRIVDNNNALNGDGPFSPERSGTLPAIGLVDLCFSGEYTRDQILKLLAGKGGLTAHLGTNSVVEVVERIEKGDEHARLVLDAMCYNMGKQIGAMVAALSGKVDAILITGGIAHSQYVVERVRRQVECFAPVAVYPGENEQGALAMNALLALRGEIVPKVYE